MSHREQASLQSIFLLLIVSGSFAARCLPPEDQVVQPRSSDYAIKLGDNSWSSSVLNNYVAGILLEEVLGYPIVRVPAVGGRQQWIDIENKVFDVILEVWPGGHEKNLEDFTISRGTVAYAGLLGPRGRTGWFVNTYTLQHIDAFYEYWRALKSSTAANHFHTDDVAVGKGAFFGGSIDWIQFDDQIIPNLGLPLEIVWTYSESALLSKIDEANDTQTPILFNFWTPHQAFSKYDLTRVFLPEHTEECFATRTSTLLLVVP
mmetsp:Transcript_25649/g.64471  ORF Transcript_25649/g.64471 Transcript_25649/m.64471 type:complete len:261 (-) Transcript_25649:50-832(-)